MLRKRYVKIHNKFPIVIRNSEIFYMSDKIHGKECQEPWFYWLSFLFFKVINPTIMIRAVIMIT